MDRIVEITNSVQSDNFIKSHFAGVIFFGSQTCPHCRRMVEPFESLAERYPSVGFAHVDSANADNADEVPVFIGYLQGVPVNKVLGELPKDLAEMVQSLSQGKQLDHYAKQSPMELLQQQQLQRQRLSQQFR